MTFHRTVRGEDKTVERKIVRVDVGQFEPKRRVACSGQFIERERRSLRWRRQGQEFRAKEQIIRSPRRLVHFDTEDVGPEPEAGGRQRKRSAPDHVGDIERGGSGRVNRSARHIEAQNLRAVQVKDRAVVDQRSELE